LRARLYDPGLVRRLQKAAADRVRRSGIKGYRNRWWANARPKSRSNFLLLYLVFVAIRMVMARAEQSTGTELLAGSASLAFAGLALQRTKQLRQALTRSFERVQSYFYPIPEGEFVARTLFQAAAKSWWIGVVGLGIFRLLQSGNSVVVWVLAGLAAIVQTLVVLGLMFVLEEHLEVIPRWLPLGLFGMAALWFFTPQKYAQGQQAWVNALPTGWVNVVLRCAWPAEAKVGVLCCAVGVFGASVWFLAQRRRGALMREHERSLGVEGQIRSMEMQGQEEESSETWGSLDDLEDAAELEEAADAVQPLPIQATWQKQRIESIGSEWGEEVRQGDWLRRWDWSRMPWLERAIGWWLNEEEKDTLWFLVGAKLPEWSSAWKNSVIALAAGVLLVAVLPAGWQIVGVIPILISLGLGLPLAGGAWAATSPAWISGKVSPLHGVYPLRYGLASRVMAKVNLMRTLVWLPLVVVLAIVDAKIANKSIADTLWLSSRGLLLWLAWMPIAITGKFSKGTNDTTLMGTRQIILVPLLILVVCCMVILWGTILIVDNAAVLLGAGGAIVVSIGVWAAYGWWYNRKVDLLRDRQ
jgi:hypothetical protein